MKSLKFARNVHSVVEVIFFQQEILCRYSGLSGEQAPTQALLNLDSPNASHGSTHGNLYVVRSLCETVLSSDNLGLSEQVVISVEG